MESHSLEKEQPFQQMVLKKLDLHMQEYKINFILKSIHRWIKYLNWCSETINFLEEYDRETLQGTGIGKGFLDKTPEVQKIKTKNQQVELHQTPKRLNSKGNTPQIEVTTDRMGEDICKLYVWVE